MQKPKFFLSLPRLLSFSGRISRLQYFVYSLFYLIALFILGAILALTGILKVGVNGKELATPASFVANSLIVLIFGYVCTANNVKRLHDFGWPAFPSFLPLINAPSEIIRLAAQLGGVPEYLITIHKIAAVIIGILTVILGLIQLFRPGDSGANAYGPDPLKAPAPVDVF